LRVGGTATVPGSLLQFTDAQSGDAQLTYTVITAPQDGTLLLNGAPASSFTQADINAGRVTYQETAAGATSDSFAFTVRNLAGATTAPQSFGFAIAPSVPGGQYNFFTPPGETINVVHSPDGNNLPPALPGFFNLVVITAPTQASYPLPAGYQGVAIYVGGSDKALSLAAGDINVADSGPGDSIFAGPGFSTIGGGQFDTISGGSNNEFIDGSQGYQLIEGDNAGDETIFGGSGDTITGGGSAATIMVGGWRFDTITGGSGTEFIDGSTGDQLITGGGAGNETIFGGAGDTINGGTGANVTIGGGQGDTITGGTGIEFIDGSTGDQLITGGSAGNETVYGGAGDTINGGTGANVTIGGGQFDMITGGTGTEFIDGSRGNQLIIGGSAGNETIWGGAGDVINGGSGANVTIGGVPFDMITGGTGTEFIDASTGTQQITVGSAGNETIWGGSGDTVSGGLAQALIGFSTVPGGAAEFFSNQGNTAAASVDTVAGFSQPRGDRILLNGASSVSQVLASAQTVNGDTTITFADGSKLTLSGVSQIDGTFFA
jgi:Ca2+-binding RTX toxin-like protein